jgi:hypothetical protein
MAAPGFEIQGRLVRLPVVVRDASAATALYVVDAGAARRWLPAGPLDLLEPWPGRALLSLGAIDYRDNDLGDYDELSIALFVRERGPRRALPVVDALRALVGGSAATWIHRLPVDQAFTCEAGRRIWGFPKTVEDLAIRREERRVICEWNAGGERVLRLELPRGGRRTLSESRLVTYTSIEGVVHRTAFAQGASGVGFHLGGASLALGRHPVADELRALGLPRRALACVWMERMHARFEGPEKL